MFFQMNFLFFILLASLSAARLLHDRFRSTINNFPPHTNYDSETAKNNLETIAVPRPADSSALASVREFIAASLKHLGFLVEFDAFSAQTPLGTTHFNSVIATSHPHAHRRLALAAHIDSKIFADFDFVGATDSAVPCAILLDVAAYLAPLILHKQSFVAIQFIFFDGEEAFVQWSDTDSIYGAKHLAQTWSDQRIAVPFTLASPPNPSKPNKLEHRSPNQEADQNHAQQDLLERDLDIDSFFNSDPIESANIFYTSSIAQMDALVLLDLLGTKDASIPNTHPETQWAWDRIVDIQSRLANANLLSSHLTARINDPSDKGFFKPGYAQHIGPTAIQDDHMPFYHLGVPVVHVIPYPFPSVWHNKYDNLDAISYDTVKDLSLIFRIFAAEYFGVT